MRRPLVIASVLVPLLATACFVVDEDLLAEPVSEVVDDPDAAAPVDDSGTPDSGPGCVPEAEICNGVDDDCDGTADEAAAADANCESRIVNAVTFCDDGKGVCVPVKCNAGFAQCDGDPGNGCEPECQCDGVGCIDPTDSDAGAETDAGS